jgi:putative phosphoesterase
MKIAILSDTHDNTPAIVWIIEYLNAHKIAIAFHAGDMINPGILFRFRDHYEGHLHFVFGNNDGEHALAERRSNMANNLTCHLQEMRLDLEGKRIFMNHYSSISETVAKSGEFDLSIGGHDHQYRVIKHANCLFINPGNTVTKDKWLPQEADKESSFVLLDLGSMAHERIMLPKEFQSL